MSGLLVMTTTEVLEGEKNPLTSWKGWHYTEEWFPAEQHTVLRDMRRGQRADVYARHTFMFALDVDAYKDGKAEAWEDSATGKYLTGIEPYVRRGTAGSMRYLVVMDDREWWPVAGKTPWGEIRSAGVGPSPGSRHPSGELYEAVDGPDTVRYPDGQVIATNILMMDDGLLDALEADGARDVSDRDMVQGSGDLPDDDGRCPLALAWLKNAGLDAATTPRGTTANGAVNYLKRLDAEGHQIGGLIADVVALLPYTSDADFEAMWTASPVPADCVCLERTCCTGTVFGFPVDQDRVSANGQRPDGPADGGSVEDDAADSQDEARPPSASRPLLDEQAARDWARTKTPGEFFGGRDVGLLAAQLAKAVMTMGPLARGTDGRVWEYRHGVYRPERPQEDMVGDRTALLLGDMYRPAHVAAAKGVTRAWLPRLTAEPDTRIINCASGLLDWRAGREHPHDPRVLSTVQLPVRWDARAACPQFTRWLAQVVPPDCAELIFDLIGYLCYSGNPLHTAVMLVGSGRNGKGTLLRVIKAILGARNVTAASLHDLVNTRFTTAQLFGKIACIAGDIDGTYLENTATLKAITGGDLISAEHKNKDRFDFTPWAVPVFSANKVPASADTSAGYLSRWLIIPFPANLEGREDRTVEDALHAELPGILAAGLRRLPALLDRGQWELPASALEAKAEFARRVDQVRTWLHECCVLDPAGELVNRTGLYSAYKMWVFRDSGKALRASEFYDRLAAAGVTPGFGATGTRGFRGIRVTDGCGITPAQFMSYPL